MTPQVTPIYEINAITNGRSVKRTTILQIYAPTAAGITLVVGRPDHRRGGMSDGYMVHVMRVIKEPSTIRPFLMPKWRGGKQRGWTSQNDVDAVLLATIPCIEYYFGWLYYDLFGNTK
jgi:hypothetical protein